MKGNLADRNTADNLLIIIHISYVIIMFLIVGFTPFYIGAIFMLLQWLHDQILGDCILTIYQRKYGFAEENEDCFHYLFRKIHFPISSEITSKFYHIIRLLIFILFLYKVYIFL